MSTTPKVAESPAPSTTVLCDLCGHPGDEAGFRTLNVPGFDTERWCRDRDACRHRQLTAGTSTETRTEYGVRGTMYRYGKWSVHADTQPDLSQERAHDLARILNDSLQRAGREPDVEVVQRTVYVGDWKPAA